MNCILILRLYNDRRRGVVTSPAMQQNLRRTCGCDLHEIWRVSECELNRLRKTFEVSPARQWSKTDVTHNEGLRILATETTLLVHYYRSGMTATCGVSANAPGQVWTDGLPGSPTVTCTKCRALLGLPAPEDEPEQANTEQPSNDQADPAPLKRRGSPRVARVENRRRRGNG